MTIPEVADLIGGENAQESACTGQEAASGVKAEYRDGWTPPDTENEQQPVGPFDAMDLADVDELPRCCICGRTITGMPRKAEGTDPEGRPEVDFWYCEKAPNCKTGQEELGI